VRATVEAAIADVERRGDAAVREMSVRFDRWDREDYRLTPAEIEACIGELRPQDLADIRFAQEQVRNFAEVQKAACATSRSRPCRASSWVTRTSR
jgi:sulfopropanediol 3-dehydrogenase